MAKFRVGDEIVGQTIDGWSFGKAVVKKIIGYSMAAVDNEAYAAEVLEATANFPVGTTVIVKNYHCAFYRSAAPKSDAPKVNVRELVSSPSASELRKMQPVGTIVTQYFPDALLAVAAVAWVGNEKHNPGEPLHWARGKSDDHLDCDVRHLIDAKRTNIVETDPTRCDTRWDVTTLPDGRQYAVLHAAEHAWRALALLQLEVEKLNGEVIRVLKVPK